MQVSNRIEVLVLHYQLPGLYLRTKFAQAVCRLYGGRLMNGDSHGLMSTFISQMI